MVEGTCDSCKTSLMCEIGGGFKNCNYGLIENNFGYGSRLDDVVSIRAGTHTQFHLCEDCYEKTLEFLGLVEV